MTLDVPPELASLAESLGASWPRTDEDMLYTAALRWTETATDLRARRTALGDPAGAPHRPGIDLPRAAATADVLAATLLALAGVIAAYKHHLLRILADLARFLTAGAGPHADLQAAALARTAVSRATRTATSSIDGPITTVLATIAAR